MIFYNSPMKIEFTDDGLVVNGEIQKYSARMLSELNEVLLSPVFSNEDKPIYLMYRNVLKKRDLRYDITVIASRIIGKEFARTYGHYHPNSEKEDAYPEVYQVLFGEAKFILQKENKDNSHNVIIISMNEGETLIIPPGYGHVSINTSREKPLFLANLVYDDFESSYEEFKTLKGPAIYYTLDGPKQNTNYIIKNLENMGAKKFNSRYGFVCSDILKEFYENPSKFEFLKKPSLFFSR
ncbi:MAG: glucose-6-phosphate isomerase family protein [Candidatus ainarchaeum sp.]|nr:glucose-6-phosphate isomerase family protein [Candidatus ainarchaeum sp.]